MAFTRGTFCGSSLRGYTSSIGWGVGQPSQMTISLVDDPKNNDKFSPLSPGSPAYFDYGNSQFYGLYQKYEKKYGIDGLPTYEVILIDPREILDGTQVIIGGYRGPVGNVKNLINAFGYWENVYFGASGSNEAGMPWQNILSALEALCNTYGGGPYGGALTLNGFQYSLDLTQLPYPGPTYRLGGSSISLMDAIAQICDDGACDFFVRLIGYKIQVCTVSRRSQPVLGKIQEVVNASIGTGTVPRASVGLEFRNETTSSFVVGGQVTTLFQTDTVRPFWGYDPDGNVIFSEDYTLDLVNINGDTMTSFQTQYMRLDASPVADILGEERYECTTFEMQCAKANYDTWAVFMLNNKGDLCKQTNLVSAFKGADPEIAGKAMLSDYTNVDSDMANLVAEDSFNDSKRLYEFVRGYAEEYMGKKYAVGLPFILRYQEPETQQIISSYNIVDAGYQAEKTNPLGLSTANEDQFRNPDGRFRCFVKYSGIQDVDTSSVPPQSSVVDNGNLFVEAATDPQILFDMDDKPYALLTLSGVLTELPVEYYGDPSQVAALFGTNQDSFMKQAKQEFMPFSISPAVIAPDAFGVPLQSLIYTYGPWSANGVPGKVLFEQDTGLTPWEYGDAATMNSAGLSKVTNAITNMQVSESGQLEFAGLPAISLGDVLKAGGPNVTNIDVGMGPQGITTTYRFQTYTPRFGVFTKGTGDRLKRLGLAAQKMRRSIRVAERNQSAKSDVQSIAASAKAYNANIPSYKKKLTPHTVMVAHNFNDVDSDGDGVVRGSMQASTNADALTLSNPKDDTEFQATAIMSYNGLFRAFSTNNDSAAPSGTPAADESGSQLMSCFEKPEFDSKNMPGMAALNPFQNGHDVETFTYGDTFASLNGFRKQPENDNARLFSLRGPMVVTGWGFGWDTSRYPSDDNGVTFIHKHMRQQQRWKTGPVDMLWDDNRKAWTCHDLIQGVLLDNLDSGGSGRLRVACGGGIGSGGGNTGSTSWEVYIHNFFSQGVSGDGRNVAAGYFVLNNSWYIIAADCQSSSGTN